MYKKSFIVSLTLFLLVLIAFSNSVTAAVWNNQTGTSYTTIQSAIDDSSAGDTIIVNGTYTENIQINKTITLTGQGPSTIQAKNTSKATIYIKGNGTTIKGFNIINGGLGIDLWANKCKITNNNITNNNQIGIYLAYSLNNTISGNKINKNLYGTYLYGSSNNTITNNKINNSKYGIDISSSSNNTITNNKINNSTHYAIGLDTSPGNTISMNNITNNKENGIYILASSGNTISMNNINNTYYGIYLYVDSSDNKISSNNIKNNTNGIHLYSSLNNTISSNNMTKNVHGIEFYSSSNNTISGNNINNNGHGILLKDSSNNEISDNNINKNGYGIDLENASNNTISWNKITNNTCGIFLYASNSNKVYRNNFINNLIQANEDYSGNLFNLTKPTGGNFWSDYSGADGDGDGFGDTPYTFMGGQDNLPIIPLKINSIDPANGTLSVPLNKTITITFNANIYNSTDYGNITVKMSNGTAKTINKTITGNKLIIKATYGWNPGMTFTVTIPKNAIKNSAGSILATDFISKFTAAIKVNSIDPANGTISVPLNKTITITFNENISIGPGYNNITVRMANGTAKVINKTITGNKLIINAIGGWDSGVKFIVTIPKNAVKNSAGSMLATDFKSDFVVAS